MPAFKTTCPDCGAILKSSSSMPPGKKVKCSKCGKAFEVPDEEAAARPKASSRKAAAPARDEDEVGTYAVIKEPEDEKDEDDDDEDEDEEKPDLTFALDTSIKDPRGPAQEAVVRPTNWVVLLGSLAIVLYVTWFIVTLFPFIFSEHFVDGDDLAKVLKITARGDEAINIPNEAGWTAEQKAAVQAVDVAGRIAGAITMGFITFFVIVCGVSVAGAVKMQTMESWTWGLIGAICLPIGSIPLYILAGATLDAMFELDQILPYGGFPTFAAICMVFIAPAQLFWLVKTLMVLFNEKVKEGFEREVEEAKKRF
jgi:predicted Zn finger-like uncharacterized protein